MSFLTVSELNRAVAQSLELHFPLMRVRGEITQVTRAASGHLYFALRDAGASVRAVMFRGRAQALDWQPKEGDQVEVTAVVTLYEPRGDFQLRVESMTKSGLGALYEAFLARKAKLERTGLLDMGRKRPIPESLGTVGLVTSMGAAALRDVVVTLSRLAPRIRIRLFPSLVQGQDAPVQLCRQLQAADQDSQVDVIMLVRGGGSLEDLWAFNDEGLAQTIAACRHCVVVGVGHESDVTIADLVADVRAATPTAAAQIVAQREREYAQRINDLQRRQQQWMLRRWERAQQALDRLSQRLRSPVDQCRERQARLVLLDRGLRAAWQRLFTHQRARCTTLSAQLHALDPCAILQRGYAMVTNARDQLVVDPSQVKPDDGLTVHVAKGTLAVRVQSSHPADSTG
jgi:exodeoxyribonuclease VII large subunit